MMHEHPCVEPFPHCIISSHTSREEQLEGIILFYRAPGTVISVHHILSLLFLDWKEASPISSADSPLNTELRPEKSRTEMRVRSHHLDDKSCQRDTWAPCAVYLCGLQVQKTCQGEGNFSHPCRNPRHLITIRARGKCKTHVPRCSLFFSFTLISLQTMWIQSKTSWLSCHRAEPSLPSGLGDKRQSCPHGVRLGMGSSLPAHERS